MTELPSSCPTCTSPRTTLHPILNGVVARPCPDPWHASDEAGRAILGIIESRTALPGWGHTEVREDARPQVVEDPEPRPASWTNVRMVLPADVDRDAFHDELIQTAAGLPVTVAEVYDIAYVALSVGTEPDQIAATVRAVVAYESHQKGRRTP